MNWVVLATVLMVAVTVVLFVQGVSILRSAVPRAEKPRYVVWFGLLTVVLAVASSILDVLLLTGALVFSPEFGIVMAQGSTGQIFLAVILASAAMAIGIGWHIARLATEDRPTMQTRTNGVAQAESNVPDRQREGIWNRLAHWPWPIIVGVIVGLLAASRLKALNPYEFVSLRIYTYDVRWPPLAIWVSIALIETGLTILRFQFSHTLGRWWVATFAVSILSLVALREPASYDPTTEVLWIACVWIILPANMSMATWAALRPRHFGYTTSLATLLGIDRNAARRPRSPQWIRFAWTELLKGVLALTARLALTVLTGVAGLLMGMSLLFSWRLAAVVRTGPLESLRWALALFLVVALQLVLAWLAGTLRLPKLVTPTSRQWGLLFLVALIVVGLVAPFYSTGVASVAASVPVRSQFSYFYAASIFAAVAPSISLIVLILAWMWLTEAVVADSLLHKLFESIKQGNEWPSLDAVISPAWTAVIAWLKSLARGVGRWLRSVFDARSTPVALLKTAAAITVLIALNEIPQAGKLVIQPFSTPGPSKELGQSISDRVLNNLGLLNQQLRPDIIIVSPSETMDKNAVMFVTATGNTASVDAALAKSSDLTIGGVTVPLGLFVAPIQSPMRTLLGVRLVNGSLQTNRDGYTLLASSSSGETWVARYPPKALDLVATESDGVVHHVVAPLVLQSNLVSAPTRTEIITGVTLLPAGPVILNPSSPVMLSSDGNTGASTLAITQPLTLTVAPGGLGWLKGDYAIRVIIQDGLLLAVMPTPNEEDVIASLAEELAFKIISTDPKLAAAGVTDSWEAFLPLKSGLEAWKEYEAGNPDALTRAIRLFKEATRKDQSSALAHYRLGLALQRDGQPGAAAKAFRDSLAADPEFVASYNALAYDLFNAGSLYYLPGVAVPPILLSDYSTSSAFAARAQEARRLWLQVTRFPATQAYLADRATAYYGLCLVNSRSQDPYLAYYYCQRAERLYAEFSSSLRTDPIIKQAEAAVMYSLGGVIAQKQSKGTFTFPPRTWSCNALDLDAQGQEVPATIDYSPSALQYYSRALAIQPDDPTVRCKTASMAYAVNDPEPMRNLESDVMTRWGLGEVYRQQAKIGDCFRRDPAPSAFYQMAFEEYQAAIDHDPTNIWALNGYAYTFWQMRFMRPNAELPKWNPQIDRQAEEYVRRAIVLAVATQSVADEATVRSTLGEVLMAQGKWTEAIQELEKANALAPEHSMYDEIRWDLAEAYRHSGRIGDAQYILNRIFENERMREIQPYTQAESRAIACED